MHSAATALLLAAFCAWGAKAAASNLPHVLFLLIDDLGWAEVGWHRPANYTEVQTPVLDELAATGVKLEFMHAYMYCSPTRSAIQSGRNPIHVNSRNLPMNALDLTNPLVGVSGIPVNMTCMATRMAEAGYNKRSFSGKADFGMAWPEQTPQGRGYTSVVNYYQHFNDYFTLAAEETCTSNATNGKALVTRDWSGTLPDGTTGPLFDGLNPDNCFTTKDKDGVSTPYPTNMTGCVYLEERITNHTIDNILSHDPANDGPLFAFHATHSVHVPLEVVPDAFERFASIDFEPRRAAHAMAFNVDREIGRIIQALKNKGMYNDTLIIFTSDNGGMLDDKGTAGGNNFPLRGGKGSNWQGGIQVPSFISGGVVPEAMRGTSLGGLMTVWDWYATLVEGVAGLNATDKQAAAAGLPPIDSVNQLDYLLGKTTTPPRQSYPIGAPADYKDLWNRKQGTAVHGVIAADTEQEGVWWKLMLGELPMDIWEGPEFPNATTYKQKAVQGVFGSCGFEPGCLFEVSSDPSEYNNVAADHPDIVARLRPLITAANTTVFSPLRPLRNDLACHAAFTEYYDAERNAGFYGPFAHLAFAQAEQGGTL